ncbi:MAG: DUF3843 family protein [Prevotellaceae bacterium]|jgi:hypothetical protein|nr:DUF3843 family protein [Prevotellaceae bacterium]
MKTRNLKRIPIVELQQFHPKGMASNTDSYFISIANKIFAQLRSTNSLIKDFGVERLKNFSVKAAAYFEDVVSQLGLFDGFRKINQKLYGKILPFYTFDQDYYEDDVNLQDIQFLVWTAMQEKFNEKDADFFINPENIGIELISDIIMDVLEEEYETAPENEILRNYLHEFEFSNIFELRQLLHWLYYNSYLSTNYPNRSFSETKNEIDKNQAKRLGMNLEDLFYLLENSKIFFDVCTPSAINVVEWLKKITRNAGLLNRLKEIDYRGHCAYRVLETNDKTIKISPFDESKSILQVARNSMSILDKNLAQFEPGKMSIKCSLVFFDGLWHINGAAFFVVINKELLDKESEKIEEKKHYKTTMEYNYTTFMKATNNKQLMFFKNFDEWKIFWLQVFPDTDRNDPMLNDVSIVNEKDFVMFISENDGTYTLPEIAAMIKMQENKYYDKVFAEDHGLAILTGAYPVSLIFIEYLINNNLIPDAGINSLRGKEHGNKLIQNNMHFIVRFFQPDLYNVQFPI